MPKHNKSRTRRSRRWAGCGIFKLLTGVILGIICFPFICFIVINGMYI